jgi:hypothetical protein
MSLRGSVREIFVYCIRGFPTYFTHVHVLYIVAFGPSGI